MTIKICIPKDFTLSPGGRFKSEGPGSGQEFRERFLERHFGFVGFGNTPDTPIESIEIVFDGGAYGYSTAFLEEAFGGLIRKLDEKVDGEKIIKRFSFVSQDSPMLIEEVLIYMRDAVSVCNKSKIHPEEYHWVFENGNEIRVDLMTKEELQESLCKTLVLVDEMLHHVSYARELGKKANFIV